MLTLRPTRPASLEALRTARWLASRALRARQLAQDLALHDTVLVAFHAYLCLRCALAPAHPGLARAQLESALLLAVTGATLVLVRGARIVPARVRSAIYRVGLSAPMIGAYFALRDILPALSLPLRDAELFAIDRALMATTPSQWLERFAYQSSVEWFAFFYYGYYALLAGALFRALLGGGGKSARELVLSLALVTALGQVGYTLVSGVGPLAYGEVKFAHPLPGGFFLARVHEAVRTAGAQLDIFPSLHTAHPLAIALHAFAHRRQPGYRFAWPLVAFAAANMLGATLFLRFHYAIDVLTGIGLAIGAHAFAARHCRRARRSARQPAW